MNRTEEANEDIYVMEQVETQKSQQMEYQTIV